MKNKPNLRLFLIKWLSVLLDLVTIAGVFLVLTLARKALGGEISTTGYFRLWPFLFLFWLIFEKLGLYNGTSIHSGSAFGPVEEIRRIIYALCAVFIVLGFGNYCYRPGDYLYSRAVLIGTCLCCAVLVPLHRSVFRKICTRFGCWGVPAVIIGSGPTARQISERLILHPEYGLLPTGFFTEEETHEMPEKMNFLGKLKDVPEKADDLYARYAILAADSGSNSSEIQHLIENYGTTFPHLLVIPSSFLTTSAGVTPRDIAGILGLEIRHNLQIPSIYRIKRVIDFLLTIPCLIASLPLIVAIAIWVKKDSPGQVFFKHRRIAKNGTEINIYKFRTMAQDASEKLETLLEGNPGLKQEWELYGKLNDDPRITRAGKWLRRTSLDELPQLFNVLQGKLTLVGPRPIVQKELGQYGKDAKLFDAVLPGITGLWQVSGRNDLTYEERVRLDRYYVNNWSVWLDIYILAKTIRTVLFRDGAK